MAKNPTGIYGAFQRFVHSEATGSILLLVATLAALAWANSPWANAYFDLAHVKIGLAWGGASFSLSLQHWINDTLMVVFFFVVGLEIKRELAVGQLSSARKAILPVSAALGGMVIPAAFYALLNTGGEGSQGWGVPMATDIAFALGILAAFGRRVPIGLKVYLTALAIADDLGAVLVIALFYTEQIRLAGLLVAAVFLVLLFLAIRLRIRRIGFLLLLITGVWAGVFASGVHATVAGILVAFLVPVRLRRDPRESIAAARERVTELEGMVLTQDSMVGDRTQLDSIVELNEAARAMEPAGIALEHYLHPVVAFFILPLFAFFNAGVALGGDTGAPAIGSISLGIILGLVLGKQIGVFAATWLAVRMGAASLPEGVTKAQIYGAGCLAGVGFTMSLFVSELAFTNEALGAEAKIGILLASLAAGIWGALVLRRALPSVSGD